MDHGGAEGFFRLKPEVTSGFRLQAEDGAMNAQSENVDRD
jgi:hypothetical protein